MCVHRDLGSRWAALTSAPGAPALSIGTEPSTGATTPTTRVVESPCFSSRPAGQEEGGKEGGNCRAGGAGGWAVRTGWQGGRAWTARLCSAQLPLPAAHCGFALPRVPPAAASKGCVKQTSHTAAMPREAPSHPNAPVDTLAAEASSPRARSRTVLAILAALEDSQVPERLLPA